MKLSNQFYQHEYTLEIARSLIGKTLCSKIDGMFCSATIIETEAYLGIEDRGSHAFGNRKTNRTSTMYLAGGIAYVYLIYGMHTMLNIVTNQAGTPHAILLRAANPLQGIDIMQQRRQRPIAVPHLLRGPGSLARGMGITMNHNAVSLQGDTLWIEESKTSVIGSIAVTPRIGIDYAGEDALLPYRFILEQHPAISGSRRQNIPIKTLGSSD